MPIGRTPPKLDVLSRTLAGGRWAFGPNEDRELIYDFRSGKDKQGNRLVWSDKQKEQIGKVYDVYETFLNLKFTAASDAPGKRTNITITKQGLFERSNATSPHWGSKRVNVNLTKHTHNTLGPGGAGFNTALHEFGHTLGLRDLYDSSFPKGVDSSLNDRRFTIMGKFSPWVPVTPMALDIAALQKMYGANMETAKGDDVYIITNKMRVACIWDTGGNDTIQYDGRASVRIDLRAATLDPADGRDAGGYLSGSYLAGAKTSQFTIANGVVIENARGGSGNDQLNGNAVANRLEGRGGNDQLTGFAGDDFLDGGEGVDTAVFTGARDDYMIVKTKTGYRVIDLAAGRDGTDELTGVEKIKFGDQVYDLANEVDVAPTLAANKVLVAENSVGALARLAAADANAGHAARATFALANPSDLFTLSADGVLTLKEGASLDYEQAPFHIIEVTVTDPKGLSTTQRLKVQLTDVEEFDITAVVDRDSALNRVNENAQAGSRVGITARAYDADGTDSESYALVNDAGGRFVIDAATGVVTVAQGAVLDFEAAGRYEIEVEARSMDGSTSRRTFTISLEDVAENVTLNDDANVYVERGVTELSVNLAGGNDTFIGSAQTDRAFGGAGDDLLTGAGGDDVLNGGNGIDTAVFSGSLADHKVVKTKTGYRVIDLLANRDGADTLTGVERIRFADGTSFDLADVVDAPPQIVTERLRAREDATGALGRVVARDPNAATGDRVRLSLADPNSIFTISADGLLSLKSGARLDFEQSAARAIEIIATDSKGLETRKSITLDLDDVNEWRVSAPVDADTAANVVEENARIGTVVRGLSLSARDADGTNNRVTYKLTNSAGGRFAIDSLTGVVTVAGPLNFEQSARHKIEVLATSQDGSTARSAFMIDVLDVAEKIYRSHRSNIYRDRGGAETLVAMQGGNDVYYGSAEGDNVRGDSGNDVLYGLGGDDRLKGGTGRDKLYGGEGRDVLYGGSGADKLYGEAGDDVLQGDSGDDELTGGAGADTFVFGAGWGRDLLRDFSRAEGDALAFDSKIFADWGALLANTRVDGADLVITRGDDQLRLLNLAASPLRESDVRFF
jgi:Ca2+-binding RTX toxin-like protein